MSAIPVYTLHRGHLPLLISMPHAGTHIPDELGPCYAPQAHAVADTDWHLPILYAFARDMGASLLIATHSRYVIDLNRPPDDVNLYPGQDTTSLCPLDDFDRARLYLPGQQPDAAEIAQRRSHYWEPYHQALQGELARLRGQHEQVALWDAHSIRSVVPRFFEGKLPDLNLGNNDHQSCAASMAQALLQAARGDAAYSTVLNGRFKGGYITRHYGKPEAGIQAIQLEMTQCCYMEESAPFAYHEQRAAAVQPLLRQLLHIVLQHVQRA